MKNKAFDCVEMKHRAAEKVQAHLAGMSDEETIAYFKRIGDEFRVRQATLRKAKQSQEMPATGTDN